MWGNCFVTFSGLEPPTVKELKQKASASFFPDSKNAFAGPVAMFYFIFPCFRNGVIDTVEGSKWNIQVIFGFEFCN